MPQKKEYVLVDWEFVYERAADVARKIQSSGFVPDAIVAIARGGWFHGRVLADFLIQKSLYSVNVEHWGITASITGEARVTNPLGIDLAGKKVLVVDDIADTGESLRLAVEHARSRGAAEVRTAALQLITTSSFVPDFYSQKMEGWKWVIFPWNFHEDMANILSGMLAERGRMTERELHSVLKKELNIAIPRGRLGGVLENAAFHRKIKREGERWAVA